VILLALESATPEAGVALATDSGVLATASASGRRHAETLAPAIEFVCRRSGVGLRELDVVAVDIGPGLFTGLRVGVGSAKALAFALGLPVVAVTSLDVIAQSLGSSGATHGRVVIPVVDARRGEVFWARYRGDLDGPVPLEEPRRSSPEELRQVLSTNDAPSILGGDGAIRYAALLDGAPKVSIAGSAFSSPSVAVLAQMGLARARTGQLADSRLLVPMYLRDADTRINWERRLPPARALQG
jgi:tRNA threonylcarbamoyladenosine biosynthesis protein TsaB